MTHTFHSLEGKRLCHPGQMRGADHPAAKVRKTAQRGSLGQSPELRRSTVATRTVSDVRTETTHAGSQDDSYLRARHREYMSCCASAVSSI